MEENTLEYMTLYIIKARLKSGESQDPYIGRCASTSAPYLLNLYFHPVGSQPQVDTNMLEVLRRVSTYTASVNPRTLPTLNEFDTQDRKLHGWHKNTVYKDERQTGDVETKHARS